MASMRNDLSNVAANSRRANSPIPLLLVGLACVIFWLLASLLQIQTSEAFILNGAVVTFNPNWSILKQPIDLVQGHLSADMAKAAMWGWGIELIYLVCIVGYEVAHEGVKATNRHLAAHLGPTGLVIGGILAYIAAKHGPELTSQVRETFPSPPARQPEIGEPRQRGKRSFIDRALGRFPKGELAVAEAGAEDTIIVPEEDIEAANLQPEADAAFAHTAEQLEVPGVPRLTIEQIVSHIERNRYEVYIGRSMTRANHPAVRINFYKRHLKLLGASQHGKTSMATALLECILRTHDPNYVQVALLDHENKASRLFANAPHIAKVRVGERVVRLYAHSEQQGLEHLDYLVSLSHYRSDHLSEEELEQQPLVIVYLEEFIDLKDYFKHRIDLVGKDDKDQAKRDYARLLFCIKKIARRGLKVLVQLLMCTQVDYRDEDLQEALVNVTSAMSFCLRVTAAQAAGFYQTELLQRNAREDKIGQAVVEMPDCKDLILAPANDLRARLKTLGKAVQQDIDALESTRLAQPSSIDERQP